MSKARTRIVVPGGDSCSEVQCGGYTSQQQERIGASVWKGTSVSSRQLEGVPSDAEDMGEDQLDHYREHVKSQFDVIRHRGHKHVD